jgi:hypothetical protein
MRRGFALRQFRLRLSAQIAKIQRNMQQCVDDISAFIAWARTQLRLTAWTLLF